MTLPELQNIVIRAIIEYRPQYLHLLDPDVTYGYGLREDLIEELEKDITHFRKNYPHGLYYIKSECKYCYPGSTTYNLYSQETRIFVKRLVITTKNDNFIVENCRNRILPDSDDGFPF